MRAPGCAAISLQPDLSAFSLTCDVDWTLSRTLYHERDALEVRTTPEEGVEPGGVEQQVTDRAAQEAQRSAARCFYLYILLVKGAAVPRGAAGHRQSRRSSAQLALLLLVHIICQRRGAVPRVVLRCIQYLGVVVSFTMKYRECVH